MKTLDRYIVRELVVPIFYASLTLISLILIADLFDNLDDVLRHHTPRAAVLRYYAALVPYSFTQTIPWAALLGTIYLLVNFGFHNEITAMKVAGLKITTIIRPIVFTGFLIGIFTFLVSDRLVPKTYRMANELREIHIERKKNKDEEKVYQNVAYYSGGNRLYYFRALALAQKQASDVIVLWLDKENRNTRQKMVAKTGAWRDGAWEFEGVIEYQMDSRGRILGEPVAFAKKRYEELNISPRDLASASSESAFLSYRELKHSIARLKENGVLVASEAVDLQHRLAFPWQSLVMMMMAIPLLAQTKTRKLIAFNVLICLGLIFVYHVTGAVGLALGKAGKVFPFASAWMSNMIFAVGSLFYLEKANY